MIYLQRNTTGDDGSQAVEIAVIEDERHVPRYEELGYSRCTLEAFRVAWRQRDERSLAQMRALTSVSSVSVEHAIPAHGVYAAIT